MRSRFGQSISSFVRAAMAVSLVVLAGAMISAPMGCGSTNDPTPIPLDDGTGTSTGTSTGITDPNSDAIPVNEISWDGDANPSTWTPVATIDKMEIMNSSSYDPTLCWNWKQPNWPYKDGKSLGNNWIIFKVNGVWHATPWEHLPKGNRVCRTTEALRGQPPFIQGYQPISAYYPQQGEPVGFMNSTIARGSQGGYTNPKQRSYIMMTKWQDQ